MDSARKRGSCSAGDCVRHTSRAAASAYLLAAYGRRRGAGCPRRSRLTMIQDARATRQNRRNPQTLFNVALSDSNIPAKLIEILRSPPR